MNKKKWILFIGAAGIAVLLAWFFQYNRTSSQVWMPLKKGPIVEAIYALGTVTSEREFRFKPGVSGTLVKSFVKEGDWVEKGAALIQLSEQPIIRASFSGTVTDLPFKEGENVFPQISVLTLIDSKNLYLSMTIEQSAALLVRKGQKATLLFESQRNDRFEGIVTATIPKEGQFVVHLSVEKLPEGILPGMTADVSITVGSRDQAVLIPLKAIQGFTAKFKENGKIDKKVIKLGIVDGEQAELLSPTFNNVETVEVAIPK